MAYLTQAVQSREYPVPLVAGERALLRVFVTAGQAATEGIPLVRARFYLADQETHVVDIPGKSLPIPTAVDESSLSESANTEIPGHVIQPGLETVVEVDPNGTLDASLGVARRIPETGRLAVDVQAMPLLDLTLIPFIWTETQDASIVELVEAIAADPESHHMLWEARTLLPVNGLAVAKHEPVQTSTNNVFQLLHEVTAIRAVEGASGHYMGMLNRPVTYAAGIAIRPGRSSVSVPISEIVAHELGHNLSLPHAPCGGARDPDPGYPYPDGSTGAWGYDFRNGGRLMPPSTPDLMSYCGPPDGISDYNFTNALRYRLFDEGVSAAAAPVATKSLLLWGRNRRRHHSFLGTGFRGQRAARAPRLRRRIPGGRTHLRWWPTLLAQLHNARGGRRRRQFQLCLRPAGATRMGGESGENHPYRPRRIGHVGRGQRRSNDDPAQSAHGTGTRFPARPAACEPRCCGRGRASRRAGVGSAV